MTIKVADDTTPKWLEVMRAITGLQEEPGSADNPKILAMRNYIARKFPEMANYCDGYQHDDTPWCGLAEAFAMAVADIRPPFGPTDTDRWMWALSWDTESDWGQHLSRPVAGCVVVMEREGGGHVTTFEYEEGGYYYCRGGNQSDSVNLSKYSPSQVVAFVWPRAAGAAPGPDDVPVEDRPMLEYGDSGPDVFDLQDMLNAQSLSRLEVDGDFGPATKEAVIAFQSSRRLEVDGIVGQETWKALYDKLPPYVPKPPPGGLTAEQVRAICDIAANSEIAEYDWRERGEAPAGYTKGVACAFANAYRQWKAGYGPAVEMAKANTGNSDKDVLAFYAAEYKALGMDNREPGADTLRHLWVLIMGLGMRESSGQHCCGRDMSVPPGYYGPESTTTEAGAWQTSYDAHGCSSEFDTLFNAYNAEEVQGFLDVFKEGVTCSSENWECYGDGDGYRHQEMSKSLPAYAAEVCGITLRNLRKHYGPIGRKEAELRREADEMLKDVMRYVDEMEVSV
jgi:uncharacterized protein (TIGR02594 family)